MKDYVEEAVVPKATSTIAGAAERQTVDGFLLFALLWRFERGSVRVGRLLQATAHSIGHNVATPKSTHAEQHKDERRFLSRGVHVQRNFVSCENFLVRG